jgi:peptide/nickel transport system substrate-binding protein
MREGLTFSDGRPVNSEAALFSFDRLMSAEAGKNLFPHLRGFNVIGDYTFSLVLDRPWPPFMASLALPQASLISPGLRDRPDDFLKDRSLGSGRFMVESLGANSVSLVLKPDLPSRPRLDRVEFYYAADPNERLAIFLEKQAHLLLEPPLAGLPQDRVLLESPTWETRYLAFNLRSPYFAIQGVREPLACLIKLAYGEEKHRPRGYFPAGLALGPVAPEFPGGKERALELLTAIGPPKTPLALAYPAKAAWAKAEAERLAQILWGLKIPVNLVPLKGQAGQAVAESGGYDLWLGSRSPEIPSPEMWLGRFLESESAGRGNTANFKNREADELIKGFRASAPLDQREKRVGELDVLAEKEAPYVFLYQKTVRFLADPRLANQKPHPMWPETWPIGEANLHPFKDVRTRKPDPPPLVREFDETVAEPWE